jgi:hypothetical protein
MYLAAAYDYPSPYILSRMLALALYIGTQHISTINRDGRPCRITADKRFERRLKAQTPTQPTLITSAEKPSITTASGLEIWLCIPQLTLFHSMVLIRHQ